MKKLNLLFQLSTLTSLLVAGFFTFAMAQNTDEAAKDQKLTIDIEVTENGKTKKITKELDAIEGDDIEAILKNLDVLDDIDISGTGERIEIKVKKEVDGRSDDKRVRVKVFGDEDEIHWHGKHEPRESRPLLGVFIESYENDGSTGALVNGLVANSAAENAGLKENDVILMIDKNTIKDEKHLREVIGDYKVGDKVEVTYLRDGSEATKTVELGESKEEGFHMNSFHFDFDDADFDEQMEKLKEMNFDVDFDMDFEFDEDAAFLGVTPGEKVETGVSLGKVIGGSSAERMGLKSGDVITRLDGEPVNSFDDLAEVIKGKKAGDDIKVEYQRDGRSNKINGELGKRDGNVVQRRIFRSGSDCVGGGSGPWSPHVVKEVNVVIELKDATKEDEALLADPADVDFSKSLAVNKIEFAPNPSDGQFNLTFDLPKKQDTRVMVFNQSGQKVYEEIMSNFSGSYRNQIDISAQPSGVYFFIIAQQDKQFTRKIVKQ